MTRRIGNDEGPPRGDEKAVSDIDRDALLPLGLEAIYQKGKVEVISCGAVTQRVLGQRGQLILENELRIMQEASDQGGLAVIHRPASEEPEKTFARLFDGKTV